MHVAVFTLLLAAGNAARLPTRSTHSLKERHNVPHGWTRVGPAPKDHILDLHIGLKQSQFEMLEKHLHEISDIHHSRYSEHLTADEVNELIKPSDETLDSVLEWLTASTGVTSDELKFSPARDFVSISLPVEVVEDLLATEYSVFQKEENFIVRTPEWSLPCHLHEHIDMIQPTNNFMRPSAQGRLVNPTEPDASAAPQYDPSFGGATVGYPNTSAVCRDSDVDPTCIRTLYGTIDYKPQVPRKNKVALANFLGEVQARADVRQFLKQYRPDAVSAAKTYTNIVINGGAPDPEKLNSTQTGHLTGIEGSLDAETIIGISYPIPLVTYSTGGSPPFKPDTNYITNSNEPYLPWLQYVTAQSDADIPYTISISYADDEQTVPISYAKRVCSLFAQLGARGVSVFTASGDYGVGPTGTCVSNDGKNRTELLPAFPASCPYVTTVGGTQNFGPEEVAYDILFSSGSGFSNYFPRPSYQDDAVKGYIAKINGLYDGFYNKSGRAYPDLAATSLNFDIVWNNETREAEGTSAAAPVAASIFTLLNDVRLAAGMKPLGFLNPLLYSSLYTGFHDVVKGSNPGCLDPPYIVGNGQGFPAKKGWDSPSGWGTPDFAVLKGLVLKYG